MHTTWLSWFDKLSVTEWAQVGHFEIQRISPNLAVDKFTEQNLHDITDPDEYQDIINHFDDKKMLSEILHKKFLSSMEEKNVHILHSLFEESYLEVVLHNPTYYEVIKALHGIPICGFNGEFDSYQDGVDLYIII